MHRLRACVLSGDRIAAFANGELTHTMNAPDGAYDLGELLYTASMSPGWFRAADEGVIVFDRLPYADAATLVSRALASSWSTTDKGTEGLDNHGWVSLRREGYPTIHVGILSMMRQANQLLFRLDWSGEAIATALAHYHNTVGVAWRGQAGMNAHALLRKLAGKSEPLWYWRVPAAARECIGSTELRWTRALTDAERTFERVAGWDVRAMYLAAAMNAELGWSAPQHTGPRAFEPSWAGYWRIRVPESQRIGAGGPPPVILPERIQIDGTAWVTTPVMQYLSEDGMPPEVLDSWTCERAGRYLKVWAGQLRDALNTPDLPDHVRTAIKGTYARGVSMLTRQGGLIYRPDWRDEVVSRALVNLRRKLDHAHMVLGSWPVHINVDEVWYPLDAANVPAYERALRVADGIGKFKPSGAWDMGEWAKKMRIAA